MRLIRSILACASLATASSFPETSPFIFFSTSEVLASPPQLTTSSSLTTLLDPILSQCLTDIYLIAHQPSVSASDFTTHPNNRCPGCLHPKYLSQSTTSTSPTIRSSFSIAQVLGALHPSSLSHTLTNACGASSTSLDATSGIVIGSTDAANVTHPRVVHIDLPSLAGLTGANRRSVQREHERMLGDMVEMHGGKSFTVLYTTTPERGEADFDQAEQGLGLEYEMDNSQVPVNMELKRDLGEGLLLRRVANASDPKAPLFEKYQYFTPALFMGLGVFVFLASILYVAISAIAGLQVSYAAFDKEQGPQAQKKQQ